MKRHEYYVYMTTNNAKKPIYTGVTNDLLRRIQEHKSLAIEGFTKKYHLTRLIYFEQTHDINAAINREKQLKNWRREKKVWLIETVNPTWKDLYEDLG